MPSRLLWVIFAFLWSGSFGVSAFAQSERLSPNAFLRESSLMLFVTVEAYEVRLELITRCDSLIRELDFQLKDRAVITPDEQEALAARATDYFARFFTFFPEGIAMPPSESKGSILKLGARDSVVKERLTDESPADAVLGVAYVYSLNESISSFDLAWNRLPAGVERLPIQLWTPQGIDVFELSEFVLNLNWSSQEALFQPPVLEAVPVVEKNWWGRPKLDAESTGRVLAPLLRNIYRAFEYPTEPKIYDHLAMSVAGETLSSIYLEYRRRIEVINQGGPKVKVLDLAIDSIHSVDREEGDFVVDASWKVSGRVTHFGHVHERINQYRASLGLTVDDGIWKLLQIEIIEENRVR